MFNKESDMQEWLDTEIVKNSSLSHIITSPPNKDETLYSSQKEYKKIYDSFDKSYDSLHVVKKITADENISSNRQEILRPDFILKLTENESIGIVELKNTRSASRQTGTELSAYHTQLKQHHPNLSKSDVIYIIISTDWSTLLKKMGIQRNMFIK